MLHTDLVALKRFFKKTIMSMEIRKIYLGVGIKHRKTPVSDHVKNNQSVSSSDKSPKMYKIIDLRVIHVKVIQRSINKTKIENVLRKWKWIHTTVRIRIQEMILTNAKNLMKYEISALTWNVIKLRNRESAFNKFKLIYKITNILFNRAKYRKI